ncbi:MAG: winged helix-turn-helix domain-containing protein [Chloroflexia bacterium]|nr:winged helix-turn-helix domain-containing protein [Chloroflexia bacterium]
MSADYISGETARRFLLGSQGLWPGRRWRGKEGAAEAIHCLASVQMDPMTVVARSHDLVLWSRVVGYAPSHLDELLYTDRSCFDYGGHLDVYPIVDLPYWSLHKKRRRTDARQVAFVAEHHVLLEQVRAEVRDRGPIASRDLVGSKQVTSYRGRKDTSLALYHLWLTGELMTHSRRGFERLYDLRERVAPPELLREPSEQEVEHHFAAKTLRYLRLATLRSWAGGYGGALHRRVDRTEARGRMAQMVAEGEAAEVRIADQKESYYLPGADVPLLQAVEAGIVPDSWQPLGRTTREEVNLLSPLDNLLGRTRTQLLFDFEYLWEVYKPVERRRWGAFTMPILYGDRLVGRLDPKLDRKTNTLRINGLWLEDESIAHDDGFVQALACGLAGFVVFHNASELDLAAVLPARLRAYLRSTVVVG